MRLFGFIELGDGLFWNNQYVGWCLWVDVSKSQTILIFMDNVSWNFLLMILSNMVVINASPVLGWYA